jgi:hypothetical protein
LRELLSNNAESLGINEKKQILFAYKEKGGIAGLVEEEEGEPSIVIHNGKRYDRV